MQMTGRPRPGGAGVLEQRRAEGAGRSVGGFVLLGVTRYLGGGALGVWSGAGWGSRQASPGREADPLRRSCPGSCCRSSCRSCWSFGVGEEALGGVGSQRERLECQLKVPDDRVVDELHAGGVDPDVVGGPPDPELVAAGGQLPDQVRESPVVGIAAGLGAQQGDRVVGHLVPVAEEPARVRVEEDEPGDVGGLTGPVQTGENSAYPRWLAVRMSSRRLSTNAGVPLIESRTRCTVDRTRCGAGRRRGGRVVAAVRIQDNIPWNRN